MRRFFSKLWRDDCGALIATEWVLVATILVIGIITGLVAVRQAVIVELSQFANAIMQLDQSYQFSGQSMCLAGTNGSSATVSLNNITTYNTGATDYANISISSGGTIAGSAFGQPACD